MTAMKPTFVSIALVAAVATGWLSGPAAAQQMDPNMRMPMSTPMPAQKPKATRKQVGSEKAIKPPAATPRRPVQARKAAATPGGSAHSHDMVVPAGNSGGADDATMGEMDMGAMPGMEPMDHDAMHHATQAPSAQAHTAIPPLTDADRAAARPPAHDHPVHDDSIQSFTLFDRLEAWNADKGVGLQWDGRAWIGTDMNRVWLRSEGARIAGRTESADLEILFGHSVAPWWDVVAGVRHDFKPGASQDFAAIGIQGMAPYKFEVDATAYMGQGGQTAARVDVEYETLLTNRLVLQPRIEVNLFGQDDPRRGNGSGLSTAEVGLRLRYEFTRRLAPYIGLTRERAFGPTAGFRRASGEDSNDTRFVAGLRLWF
ncbi:copper resistance protein B [Cognatiluteimonas profundi]|uniref:copper resistance protein B n=1 Tax=Cognatiluteimonas profundi TaxID=2594501 RepID=UPI00131A84DF|nr:copper resistance protein B [Lysobacter profundi]